MPSIKKVKWKKSKYLCNQAHQLYSNTSTLDPSIFLMPRNILKLSFLYGSSNQILLSTQSENGILQIREIPMITPDFSWKKVHVERTFRESRSNKVQIRTKLNVSLLLFHTLPDMRATYGMLKTENVCVRSWSCIIQPAREARGPKGPARWER